MNFPDFFKVTTGKESRNKMVLKHNHISTTDFFHIDPVVCREVVPNDDIKVDIASFVRFFPMPFPTYGRIKYYNRVFFVPYRMIMEGFNNFITDTKYPSSSGLQAIDTVPQFKNSDACNIFLESDMSEEIEQELWWRPVIGDIQKDSPYSILCNNLGKVVHYTYSTTAHVFFIRYNTTNELYAIIGRVISGFYHWEGYAKSVEYYGSEVHGTYTDTYSSSVRQLLLSDTVYDLKYCFEGSSQSPYFVGEFKAKTVSSVDYLIPPFNYGEYEMSAFDFMYAKQPNRFLNKGRNFYNLLTRLGYRLDFSTDADTGEQFTNTSVFSAGKLLAFVKVYLDWYTPSQYAQENDLLRLFYGTSASGVNHKVLTTGDLYEIASIQFGCYDRDYFTAAWQNPSGPGVNSSPISVVDGTVKNAGVGSSDSVSKVVNYKLASQIGSDNSTPSLVGQGQSGNDVSTPLNISYYMLETLRALTNWMRRHQLSGYRTIDRYLAQYGRKLSDDRVSRCYYIGGYSYDAEIKDIMSTSDTEYASLGDFAGKGIAYSDAHREFNIDNIEEYGFVIVLASVVPDSGYVQGYMRENRHLTRFDHFQGDFDNLGTQAIEYGELFADRGLKRIDQNSVAGGYAWDRVFGFTPRYMEYKIGYNLLTGDFNIPSRREGMDAFHLNRLFKDANFDSINRGFMIGEQAQYDRIFNNQSDDYDHMYIVHQCDLICNRPMKSASDVYDFEHAPGQEIKVDANGTQLN